MIRGRSIIGNIEIIFGFLYVCSGIMDFSIISRVFFEMYFFFIFKYFVELLLYDVILNNWMEYIGLVRD